MTLLSLAASSGRIEDETTLREAVGADRSQAYLENRRDEFEAKFFVLHESFESRGTRMWSEIYCVLCNCWFYCDSGLFEERAICGVTSGQRSME